MLQAKKTMDQRLNVLYLSGLQLSLYYTDKQKRWEYQKSNLKEREYTGSTGYVTCYVKNGDCILG